MKSLGSKSKDIFETDFVFGKKMFTNFPVDTYNRAFTSMSTFLQKSKFVFAESPKTNIKMQLLSQTVYYFD